MSIIEFLKERISEDEQEAKACLAQYERGEGASKRRWTRMLAECKAKREIIKQHESWPVLVEKQPDTFEGVNVSDMTMRITRQIAWLTEREYVKKFGEAPPTTPMIRTIAAVYKDHADYQEEWEL